jgi:hypothetical protein
MHGHAARLTDAPVRPLLRQALFIEAVTGLMQHAHEGGEEITLVVARGHAHVGGHATAEGMMRDIEAAMVEIEAHGLHHGFAQGLLAGDGESCGEGFGGCLALRFACASRARGMKGVSTALSSAKTGVISAMRLPGSNCSISAS